MGICIALGFASVIAIAIGIALAKAKETQLWYILSIIGTAVLTVMIVFIINYAISANTSVSSPALENTNWREQKSYSRDYQLTDDLSICVSLLDDSSGYAEFALLNIRDNCVPLFSKSGCHIPCNHHIYIIFFRFYI